MIAEDMYELGSKKSTIRTIFEYGRQRAAVVGEENILLLFKLIAAILNLPHLIYILSYCYCSPLLSLPCPRHLPKTAHLFCRIAA